MTASSDTPVPAWDPHRTLRTVAGHVASARSKREVLEALVTLATCIDRIAADAAHRTVPDPVGGLMTEARDLVTRALGEVRAGETEHLPSRPNLAEVIARLEHALEARAPSR